VDGSDSSLAIIQGAGHLIQLDAPAALVGEVTRWLDAQG